ncbi:MAG TPA: vitamin B12 dependent methionine synthase [Deltaproteobacteria bacterium]|nr:vitamin B12 dependent methionine synthase [Deltaproteobacteria bacterium]
MDAVIIDTIPLTIDEPGFLELMRIRPESRQAGEFRKLLSEARHIARPKAAFRPAYLETSDEDSVTIEGTRFSSRVLTINLREPHLVFPFIATCGAELQKWATTIHTTLHCFWADSIQLMALGCAVAALDAHLREITGSEKLSAMHPGSLEDWPLSEQIPLFNVLGEAPGRIGVTLTHSMLLMPLKSTTGIQFVSEDGFTNCMLCPREDCPGRRVPFERHLLEKKYNVVPGRSRRT